MARVLLLPGDGIGPEVVAEARAVLAEALKYALGVEAFIFTTYLEAPWEVFAARCDAIDITWFPMASRCAAVSGLTFLFSTAVSVIALRRCDLG